jgi:hypothetical protein
VLLVAAVDGIKLTDVYLQEQLEKVLNKTLDDHKPTLSASSDHVRILFNTSNLPPSPTKAAAVATTTTNAVDESNMLKVSYCYATKEWRCLYRCEIDSSVADGNASKVDLTLFGSVKNPTEEDWSQIELVLVANELEILNNNKPTTSPSTRDEGNLYAKSSGGMQIFMKTMTGKTITLEVCTHKDLFISYRFYFVNNSVKHQIKLNKSKQKFKIKKAFLQISNE